MSDLLLVEGAFVSHLIQALFCKKKEKAYLLSPFSIIKLQMAYCALMMRTMKIPSMVSNSSLTDSSIFGASRSIML